MKKPNYLKQFGAKVKKDGLGGYYIYEGVNFKVKFNSEYCVGSKPTWRLNVWEDDVDKKLLDELTDGFIVDDGGFETKREIVGWLYQIDKRLSIN